MGGRTTHKHEQPLRTKLITSSCLSRKSSKPKTSFKMEWFDSSGRFARRRSSEPGGYADDAAGGAPAATGGTALEEALLLGSVLPLERLLDADWVAAGGKCLDDRDAASPLR